MFLKEQLAAKDAQIQAQKQKQVTDHADLKEQVSFTLHFSWHDILGAGKEMENDGPKKPEEYATFSREVGTSRCGQSETGENACFYLIAGRTPLFFTVNEKEHSISCLFHSFRKLNLTNNWKRWRLVVVFLQYLH